ncbi:hypothetical protein ACF046_03670 [Glutamicibacter creatinolyticus]|nr:hypothetical protein [Glutamicibacter creatinolyticus]
MTEALQPVEGLRAPVARMVAVHDGQVVLNEIIPGLKVENTAVDTGPFPNFVALARARGGAFSYLVAEAGRAGGEVHLYNTTSPERVASRGIVGVPEETHVARKVPGEYDQPKNQAAAEEMARRNAEEVADLIREMAHDNYVRLIVISGDVKSREMVRDYVHSSLQPLVAMLEANTRTGGADRNAVDAEIRKLVDTVTATELETLSQRVADNSGNSRANLALGINEVVEALQQAQADTILVSQYQDEHTLRALSAEPWVAVEDDPNHAELVIGQWPAPEVLLRATALTDATIRYVPDGLLPNGVGIAALLRWPRNNH